MTLPDPTTPSACDRGKSQVVRAVDVLVLGPWLLWLALRERPLDPLEKGLLGGVGAATILYNACNYLRIRRERIEEAPHAPT